MTHTVGYARTSTADQEAGLRAQIRDLEAAGATRVFAEQLSGKDRNRPELERALDYLRDGDTFMATKIDRVARSATDLEGIRKAVNAKGATFQILEPPTTLRPGDTDPFATFTLQIFGAMAQMEVALMKERQREGIREAQAAGRFAGRQPTAQAKAQALLDAMATGLEPTEAAKSVKISRASAFRILRARKAALRDALAGGADPEAAAKTAGIPRAVAQRMLGRVDGT